MPDPLDLDALEAAEKAATPAPWFLVGEPWASGQFCETYAVAGSPDPHGRAAVLQWVEVDEVTADDEGDLSRAAQLAEATQRANLAIAVRARNAAPALIARARLAERMAEILAAIDEGAGPASFESIVTPVQNWSLAHVKTVLREWDALNEKGGTE